MNTDLSRRTIDDQNTPPADAADMSGPGLAEHTRTPWRDDVVTTSQCLVCTNNFTRIRRQKYCSPACRQEAFRSRQPITIPTPPPAVSRRSVSVYQCEECEQRYLASQWCYDCSRPCRRLGFGGTCPCCDEPVSVTELINIDPRNGLTRT